MSRRQRPDRKPDGRKPLHGARALQRALDANALDGRTKLAKGLRSLCDEMATERGGWAACSVPEQLLIRRLGCLALLTDSIESYALSRPNDVLAEGKLMPVLAKNYLAFTAQLTRTAIALGIKPPKGDGVDLEAYLAAKERAAAM